MAKVENNILGQLSGKLGGVIFSHNQFGSHVYLASTKIDRPSPFSHVIKNLFSSNPTPYSSLTAAQHIEWKTFVSTVYVNYRKPKHKRYTPYSAFLSCSKTMPLIQANIVPCDILLDPIGHFNPAPIQTLNYLPDSPIYNAHCQFLALDSTIYQMNFVYAVLSYTAVCNFNFTYYTGTTFPWTIDYFEDCYGQPLGIGFYLSGMSHHSTGPFANPFKTFLFFTGFFNFPANTFSMSRNLSISLFVGDLIHSKLKWHSYARWYLLTAVVFTPFGTMCPVGSFICELLPS